MDWYIGSNIDEFVVPKKQELSDRFPSPESWPKWGISESESFEFPNESFVIDSKLTHEVLNFNFSNEVEVESSVHDKDQSSSIIGGGSSEESLQQTALSRDHLDYQLDGLAGFEHMDDQFLSSLMEDPPGTENLHKSFYFEPELLNCIEGDDNISTYSILDALRISSDAYSMGSSKYLKTHAFSPSMDPEEGKVSASPPFIPSNSEQKNCPLLKASLIKVLAPSEHKGLNEHVDEETSLEETVLQELAMVMAQLTDKTRMCFRDAFYRLANTSSQHVTWDRNGNLSMESSPWTCQEDKMRPGRKKTMELETNAIDRALTNLMFNKTYFNVHDFPVSSLASSKQESLKAT
ncbi:hypothetical protein GH714_036723 [Hevea brasiliensis]|uniref:Protein LNK3 n=1 Tax=Hevea brasiliensis TaxID=3981 RepID=A0A6A6NEZ5_HEVBR|nr:hypothetical protein GH714_036723 [Hevea brasiliensis]